MIRDVAELREVGQVCRRVAELDVDVGTWRAGMRAAARREGMRIRTFIVEPTPPPADTDTDTDGGDSSTGEVLDGLVEGLDDVGEPEDVGSGGPLVYAVRTDLPSDLGKVMAAMDQLAADRLGPTIADALRPSAPVTSLTEERARRSGHPSAEPGSDQT